MTPPPIFGRLGARRAALLFLASCAVYALVAFDRIKGPSEHRHFVDLAESMLRGELETRTPKRTCGKEDREGDPPGLNDFVCDHTRKPDGGWQGWNDWASFHEITLTDDTVLRGVWRWRDTNGTDRNKFETLDGELYIVDPDKDLKRGCDPSRPGGKCDEQRWYMSFPPGPSVLMMPFVAIWHYHLNDVLWTVLFAGANVLLLLLLLERLSLLGWSARSLRENLLLAVLFGFGTSLFFSSVRGEVWFTALVMGFTFHVAYVTFALDARQPLLAGVALALAYATRTPIAFAAVFFGLELLKLPDWGSRIRRGLVFSLPILITGALLMAYNHARFGSFGEFGHAYLQDGMRPSIREHGLFSPWFLNVNLSAALSNVPILTTTAPFVHITRHGLSLFAATPALLLLLWPQRWHRGMTSALLALLAVAVPGLFYQNTGWAQFSYRFSIDYLPYMAVLLATGGRPHDRRFRILTAVSIVVALFGAVTFGRFDQFYFG